MYLCFVLICLIFDSDVFVLNVLGMLVLCMLFDGDVMFVMLKMVVIVWCDIVDVIDMGVEMVVWFIEFFGVLMKFVCFGFDVCCGCNCKWIGEIDMYM